jgi:integrase/recombinase XerD
VTKLRQRMLEELQRRNFAPSTIRYYIRTVRDFAAYFHKPPDRSGVEELRQFQLHMLRDQKLATGTVENRMTALHFFFRKVLKRYDPELYDMQLTRVPKKLPVVLSPEEVEKLIAAAPNIRYRTILLLLYATGLRRAEASQLKIADIDSQRMIIHVREGKNSRDRELPLTPKLLDALRAYWRACKVKPRVYLFPARSQKTDQEQPTTDKTVWHACIESARRAGLSKRLGPHTLRHAFAYCTTFQSSLILKIIELGRAGSAGVYGRRAGPLSLLSELLAATGLSSR